VLTARCRSTGRNLDNRQHAHMPLLATHLSLAEIAAELAISHNTVKSQTASLYRKLMATSREQAVARSRELSLLDG
jgi:LuxR family maltose regulon positive regulatory protein